MVRQTPSRRPAVSYGYCDRCGELARVERIGRRIETRCDRCTPRPAQVAAATAPRRRTEVEDVRSRRTIGLALGLASFGLVIFLLVVWRGRSADPTLPPPSAGPEQVQVLAEAPPVAPERAAPVPAPAVEPCHGNSRTKVLHQSRCELGATISPSNRRAFASPDEALLEGYRWCRSCAPQPEREACRTDSTAE